jgi:hypothetical protein
MNKSRVRHEKHYCQIMRLKALSNDELNNCTVTINEQVCEDKRESKTDADDQKKDKAMMNEEKKIATERLITIRISLNV